MTSDVLLELLASPEIASKRLVWRQYDHQVGTNTVIGPGSDAAVIRIKGTRKAIAIATDGNAAYTHLDPYAGGAIAVCEAARNVSCTGAKPIAMTNCLNFGNPERLDVYWQLSEAIRGMADAARALNIPVISGNVSLYNETNGEAIWPTPVVGIVGLLEDVDRLVPMGFQDVGDGVLLVGARTAGGTAGSVYASQRHSIVAGRPDADLEAAWRLQAFLVEASNRGLLKSAHDVGPGGVAVALAEACIAGDVGVALGTLVTDAFFGEGASRVVVSAAAEDETEVEQLARKHGIAIERIGVVAGDRMRSGTLNISVGELRDAYESCLPRALEGATANI
jgi:phosphoribosylformylglycinamidine synthase